MPRMIIEIATLFGGGNKLYPIMKDGINELPLVKISKKQAKKELQDFPFFYNVKD